MGAARVIESGADYVTVEADGGEVLLSIFDGSEFRVLSALLTLDQVDALTEALTEIGEKAAKDAP